MNQEMLNAYLEDVDPNADAEEDESSETVVNNVNVKGQKGDLNQDKESSFSGDIKQF